MWSQNAFREPPGGGLPSRRAHEQIEGVSECTEPGCEVITGSTRLGAPGRPRGVEQVLLSRRLPRDVQVIQCARQRFGTDLGVRARRPGAGPRLSGQRCLTGSAQTTRNGDLFVSWGGLSYFSEFSPSGKLLFNAKLPDGVSTYRAYRLPWNPGS
jgi:hypothetical protein